MTTARVNEYWVSGFTAETPVLMADGTTKPISKVREGEWVRSFDPKTGRSEPGRVINTWAEVMDDLLDVDVAGKSMTVAASQLFYTPKGDFKSAPDADGIMTEDGRAQKFTFKKSRGKRMMHDITIGDTHAFVANGLMVHNKGSKKRSPPPAPQPVVTVGRVGEPLTVGVNGTVITVVPGGDSAARVSVISNKGAMSSIPGVVEYRMQPDPIRFPNPPLRFPPKYSVDLARSIRNSVCTSMQNTEGHFKRETRNSWIDQLNQMARYLRDAQRLDPGPMVCYPSVTNYVSGAYSVRYDNYLLYNDALSSINALKKFVAKEHKLSSRDLEFITSECSRLQNDLDAISFRLAPPITTQPVPVPTPVPVDPPPPAPAGKIYSTDSKYSYMTASGMIAGCDTYNLVYPNQPSQNPTVYYKHFDNQNGKFYYDAAADNCI